MAIMEDVNERMDQDAEPQLPSDPAPPITSRFLFVDVAALRAKQLRRGARVRFQASEAAAHKAERVAMEEVRRGLVYYDVPAAHGAAAMGGIEGEA
jgi:DNA-directed RNA polymerase subunit K/omega